MHMTMSMSARIAEVEIDNTTYEQRQGAAARGSQSTATTLGSGLLYVLNLAYYTGSALMGFMHTSAEDGH